MEALLGVGSSIIARIKPHDEKESRNYCLRLDGHRISLNAQKGQAPLSVQFEAVYGPTATTNQLYEENVAPFIEQFVNGTNVAVVCCGCTGSGKSFTMEGQGSRQGVIALACNDIFKYMKAGPKSNVTVALTYVELLNEKFKDLLNPDNQNLSITESTELGYIVDGATMKEVRDAAGMVNLYYQGQRHRSYGATKDGAAANLATTLFIVDVFRESLPDDTDPPQWLSMTSRLMLLDMQSLEALDRFPSDDDRKRPCAQSLHALNDVVMSLGKAALAAPSEFNPLRLHVLSTSSDVRVYPSAYHRGLPAAMTTMHNSAITKLLSEVVAGNGALQVLVMLDPIDRSGCTRTLGFASAFNQLSSYPLVNDDRVIGVRRRWLTRIISTSSDTTKALDKAPEPKAPAVDESKYTTQITDLKKEIADLQKQLNTAKESHVVVAKPQEEPVSVEIRREMEAMQKAYARVRIELESEKKKSDELGLEIIRLAHIQQSWDRLNEEKKALESALDKSKTETNKLLIQLTKLKEQKSAPTPTPAPVVVHVPTVVPTQAPTPTPSPAPAVAQRPSTPLSLSPLVTELAQSFRRKDEEIRIKLQVLVESVNSQLLSVASARDNDITTLQGMADRLYSALIESYERREQDYLQSIRALEDRVMLLFNSTTNVDKNALTEWERDRQRISELQLRIRSMESAMLRNEKETADYVSRAEVIVEGNAKKHASTLAQTQAQLQQTQAQAQAQQAQSQAQIAQAQQQALQQQQMQQQQMQQVQQQQQPQYTSPVAPPSSVNKDKPGPGWVDAVSAKLGREVKAEVQKQLLPLMQARDQLAIKCTVLEKENVQLYV